MPMHSDRPTEEPLSADVLGEVLWRRRDHPAYELCRVQRVKDFRTIQGCVLTMEGGRPFRIDYLVRCDTEWNTSGVYVQAQQGNVSRRLELERDDSGVWTRGGEPIAGLDGLIDIDLGISPSTNTLPIRRLQWDVGSQAAVDAAWVRFPELSVERLSQRYTRTGERSFRYETCDGSFSADLEVDDEGIVVRYGDIWERVEMG